MNCRRIVSMMSAYVDGELTGVDMLEIRRHLSDCEECSAEYESIRLTKHALARLATARPRPDFAAALFGQLDAVKVTRPQRMFNFLGRRLSHKLSPVGAALAASGLALVILSSGAMDTGPQATATMANAAFGSRYEQAGFLGDLREESPVIYPTQPLRVATETSTLGEPNVRFASFDTSVR